MIKYYKHTNVKDKESFIILIQDKKYDFNSSIHIIYKIKSLKILSVKMLSLNTTKHINMINNVYEEIPAFVFNFDEKYKKILKNAAIYLQQKYNMHKTILDKVLERYELLE